MVTVHQLELPGLNVNREDTLEASLTWLLDHGLECGHWTRSMHAQHRRMLIEFFGPEKKLRDIKYADLKRYLDSEVARGRARETVRKRLTTLRMAMDEALRREEPWFTKLPPWVVIKSDTKKTANFWVLDEWQSAHDACDDDDEFRLWIDNGFWLGMHTSDLNRFRWADVDLFKKTWIRRCTKSKSAPVALPLPEKLHRILLARYGEKQPHPRDLVAGRDMGHPNRQLREICLRAGVPVISPIGLRHSCETFLAESGTEEQYQVTWLGHKSPKMLKTTYRHTTPKTLEDNLAKVNAR